MIRLDTLKTKGLYVGKSKVKSIDVWSSDGNFNDTYKKPKELHITICSEDHKDMCILIDVSVALKMAKLIIAKSKVIGKQK